MSKQPSMKFKDLDEGYKWLRYYQDKLFLQDWNIRLEFEPAGEDSDTGAQVYYHQPEKEAVITIFRHSAEYYNDYTGNDFDYYSFIKAGTVEDYKKFVASVKEKSLYQTGTTAKYRDKLLTLSTCEYSQKNGRMVLVAKKNNGKE